MATVTPASRSAATVAAASGFSTSATATRPSARPAKATYTTVLPDSASAAARGASASTSMPRASISARLPSSTRPSGAMASTPWPGIVTNPATGGNASPSALACSTTAAPIGCSEPCSAAAASASTSLAGVPSSATTSVTAGRPTVSVPVLSKTTVSTRCRVSSAVALRNSTPCSAPRPAATMIAVGVARPIAHGQAMTSTATAFVSAWSAEGAGPSSHQPRNVSAAMTSTTGTKTAATRSASRWMGAREPWASSTSLTMRASVVSLPTRVARNTKLPVRLTVPPNTTAPGVLSRGTLSPVSIDSSTVEAPSTTTPSTGMRSPERDERDDDGGRLVIGHGPGRVEDVRPQRDRHAEEIGGAGAERHERGHARAAMAQVAQEAGVELGADPELHGRGQQELQPRVGQPGRRPWKDLRHASDEQRRREHGAHQHPGAQPPLLGLARAPLTVLGLAAAHDGRGAELVAGRGHRLLQRRHAGARGVEGDGGLLGGEVDRGALHAGHAAQRALDLADAGGAVHAAHRQRLALGHHLPPNRANTSSSSSIFCWRSDLEPERRASATHVSMCRPSSSFCT